MLPADLPFLISDQGTYGAAQTVARYAEAHSVVHSVVHVCAARHPPASNGRAAHGVRTLTPWFTDQTWAMPTDVPSLLACFQQEYNLTAWVSLACRLMSCGVSHDGRL